eukprot:364942-Chlamydomonas_euryale.AAC.11
MRAAAAAAGGRRRVRVLAEQHQQLTARMEQAVPGGNLERAAHVAAGLVPQDASQRGSAGSAP